MNNIAQTSQSIMDAIQDAKEKTGLEIENVVAGIAGQNIISRSHSDYIIREDPDKLIDFEDSKSSIHATMSMQRSIYIFLFRSTASASNL